MSNLLNTPSSFKDAADLSPPAIWDGTQYRYQYTGNDPSYVLILTAVTDGTEFLAFTGTARGDSWQGVRVRINGLVVFENQFYKESFQYISGLLPEGATASVELFGTGIAQVMDIDLIPMADDAVGTPEPIQQTDTYVVKAFTSYGYLADNDANDIAPIGELSVYSRTYARDCRTYSSTTTVVESDTTVDLTVFSSKLTAGGDRELTPNQSKLLLDVGKFIHEDAVAGTFGNDPEVLRQRLMVEFETQISDVRVNTLVPFGGTGRFPESVSFYIVNDTENSDYDRTRVRLWFSDAAFQAQYDEYQIDIIPPIPNIDDFFNSTSQVELKVQERTLPQLMDLVQLKANEQPYTVLRTEIFNYHTPLDEDYRLPTNWTFLIYGGAGNNLDAIKFRLIEWILANSTHTREEWAERFPDIFTATEFIITPLWDQFAVPNKTLEMGVYSPIIQVEKARDVARLTGMGVNYSTPHIDDSAGVLATTFKSIVATVVGGPENRDGVSKLADQWPDYMAVGTSSADFNRMRPQTQGFVLLLQNMFRVAEQMSDTSDVPQGMTRITRTDSLGRTISYVAASYQNVQYLVVTRGSYYGYFAPSSAALRLLPDPETLFYLPSGSNRLIAQFSAIGGLAPYTYSAASPYLLSGGINSITGALDVRFSQSGVLPLTVTVRDVENREFVGHYTVSSTATP